MVFLPLSMRGESWGSYFVFLQPNSLTLHIAALGDGKCTENITKFEFIKNLFLLKPATATLVKKKPQLSQNDTTGIMLDFKE